ncbi:response regulator [Desulfonatronum thioautotrophicum]|uniref:response regulator n=1 Tax=Desulfonatronum thioautotrophicum TaxID=617001 RepID=UPI0005EAD2D0|nr:response regulator [Desulfonatronum thioautotrophicum]
MVEQMHGTSGMKLLLVDDEERFRTTLAKRLADKGIDVTTLDSGVSALRYILEHPVDVIVLDIKMPELDGIETLKEIKKINPGIEVILLTGHGSIDTAIVGMRLGAYDYLMKPCELEILLKKIIGAYAIKNTRDIRLVRAEMRSRLDKMEKSVRL